jgi:hypothetical protein
VIEVGDGTPFVLVEIGMVGCWILLRNHQNTTIQTMTLVPCNSKASCIGTTDRGNGP